MTAAMSVLIPLMILLPALGVAVALASVKHLQVQRTVTFFTLFALIIIAVTMVFVVDKEGIHTVQIGGWDAPIGITLVADRLSTLMLAVLRA